MSLVFSEAKYFRLNISLAAMMLTLLASPGWSQTRQAPDASPPRLAQGDADRGMAADRVLSTEGAEPSIDDLAARLNHSDRILGGSSARPGQWPSMVALFQRASDGRVRPFCGGTVVAKRWVLTAAHCAKAMQRASDASYFIREGTTDLTSNKRRDVPVSRIFIFDKYDSDRTLNDAALLELAGSASSPPQTLLGRQQIDQTIKPRSFTTVVGFGLTTEDGSPSANLLQVDVPVVSQEDCKRVYGGQNLTNATFCAGTKEGGKDSCQGDSGGPAFMATQSGQPAQVGIVSWGHGCGRPGVPGVYASVGYFEDWIRSKAKDVVFYDSKPNSGSSTAVAATDHAISAIGSGAATTQNPSALAQVAVGIVQGDQLRVGTIIDIRVLSSIDGKLALFNEDSDGRTYQIFPTQAMTEGGAVDSITAGQAMMIPPPRLKDRGFRFRIKPPLGKNRLVAVVVPKGAKVDDILATHQDGSDFYNLDDVLRALDQAMRGIEVVQVPPENRAVAVRNYEILD